MPPFNESVESIAAKVFGRAPRTTAERSFVQSVGQRKQGAAAQGAFEFAKQQGSSPFGGGEQQDEVMDSLGQARQAIIDANKKVQQANQKQFTTELRNQLRSELLSNPGIQELIKMRGKTEEQIQQFDSQVSGEDALLPTAKGELKGQALGSLVRSASDISGALATRGQGVNSIIEGIRAGAAEDLQRAQTEQQSASSLLGDLIGIQQEERAQDLFGLQQEKLQAEIDNLKKDTDIGNLLDNVVIDESQLDAIPQVSDEELIAAEEENRQQTLSPAARQEFLSQVRGQLGSIINPASLVNRFRQSSVLSTMSNDERELAERELSRLILGGDLANAEQFVKRIELSTLPASEQTSVRQLESADQIVDIYERLSNTLNTGSTSEEQIEKFWDKLNIVQKNVVSLTTGGVGLQAAEIDTLPLGIGTQLGREFPEIGQMRALTATLASIAKAFGDTGRLSDQDIQRAARALPDPFDPKPLAQKKIQTLREVIRKAKATAPGTYTGNTSVIDQVIDQNLQKATSQFVTP